MSADQVDNYALFGHPVAHSWSPFIHGLFAQQLGIAMRYTLIDVEPAAFRRRVVDFFMAGGRGLNITVPHKAAAFEVCNECTPRATRAGAVNTIALHDQTVLYGDNTDGAGLVRDLVANLGMNLAARRILLLGAGGATRGVLAPLLDERPALVLIANRTVDRAVKLAASFRDSGPVEACGFEQIPPGTWDLVINATSAGLSGGVPPLAPAVVGRETVCYDMSYGRDETPFVRWARQAGARRAYKGWGMLVEQAAEAFELWRGVRPETGPVLAALTDQ